MKCQDVKVYFNPTDGKVHLDAQILPDSIKDAEQASLDLSGKIADITAKKYAEKRSLSANAYYWTLVNKLASAMKMSKSRMHNMLLRRYGTVMASDTYVMVPDTDEAFEREYENEVLHLKPTSSVVTGKNGRDYRLYMPLLGSSQMDADQMSDLIDGIVDECKQVGIETMTPREIQDLIERERERRC